MDKKEYIYNYIVKSGILLLGSNSQFDNLMDIGGDWDTIMELIQERKVYFSKIFKGMTTYISDEMYPYFKIMKNNKIIGEHETRIYDFLEHYGGQDTELIKEILGMDKKTFDTAMNNLLKNMQITVLGRGVTLNKQWSTYVWGTYVQWEKEANLEYKIISIDKAYSKIFEKLIGKLSEKKINNLLNNRPGGMEMKTHLRYPLWISWEITNKCNYKCIHCRMDELNDFNKELSTDEVISCINQLNEIGVYQINYSGGEPFLRNDFIDILEYTSKSNIKIGVTTNGSLIDEEIVKKLKMIKNLDFIQISLDGRDNATHNHIRGINGAYETAIETIRMLVNSNFNVGVVTTVMKPNVKQIPDILNKLTELGVNMFGARRFMPTGKGNNSADLLAVNTDEYCSHIHYWVDSINNKDNKVKCIIEEPLLSILRDKLPVSWKFDGCQAGDQYGAITANGDIRACIFIPVKLGNIKEQNFKSIWETSKIREKIILRELNGSCKVCNLIKECGGCRAAAYLNTGDYLGDDPMCFYKNT